MSAISQPEDCHTLRCIAVPVPARLLCPKICASPRLLADHKIAIGGQSSYPTYRSKLDLLIMMSSQSIIHKCCSHLRTKDSYLVSLPLLHVSRFLRTVIPRQNLLQDCLYIVSRRISGPLRSTAIAPTGRLLSPQDLLAKCQWPHVLFVPAH